MVEQSKLELVGADYQFKDITALKRSLSELLSVYGTIEVSRRPQVAIDTSMQQERLQSLELSLPEDTLRRVQELFKNLELEGSNWDVPLDEGNNFYAGTKWVTDDAEKGTGAIALGYRAPHYESTLKPLLEELCAAGLLVKIGNQYGFRDLAHFEQSAGQVAAVYAAANYADASSQRAAA